MNCNCGNPNCPNVMFVDSEAHTIRVYDKHNTILIYLDLEAATELVKALEKLREDILEKGNK